MAVNINIPKPVIDYNDLDNKPNLVTEHSELILDDGTNPHGTTASDVGALPMPTGTTSQYLRGDGSLETFPTIPNPANFVAKADYTPAHSLLVQQSGTGNPTPVQIGNNEFLGRKTGGGADIEGLSVSEAKTILNYTASDVGAPSGSGTSTGTNTGDETQASILAKLGWWNIQDQVQGTVSSGTSNTISKSIALPFVPTKLKFRAVATKTNSNATFTIRVYLSEVDNNIGGTAILIATLGSSLASNNFAPIKRDCDIVSGNIKNTVGSSVSIVSDDTLSGIAPLNVTIPSDSPLYLIFAVQCNSASDTARIESVEISNF
jgi:hypothetical protein